MKATTVTAAQFKHSFLSPALAATNYLTWKLNVAAHVQGTEVSPKLLLAAKLSQIINYMLT